MSIQPPEKRMRTRRNEPIKNTFVIHRVTVDPARADEVSERFAYIMREMTGFWRFDKSVNPFKADVIFIAFNKGVYDRLHLVYQPNGAPLTLSNKKVVEEESFAGIAIVSNMMLMTIREMGRRQSYVDVDDEKQYHGAPADDDGVVQKKGLYLNWLLRRQAPYAAIAKGSAHVLMEAIYRYALSYGACYPVEDARACDYISAMVEYVPPDSEIAKKSPEEQQALHEKKVDQDALLAFYERYDAHVVHEGRHAEELLHSKEAPSKLIRTDITMNAALAQFIRTEFSTQIVIHDFNTMDLRVRPHKPAAPRNVKMLVL